jgi:hypothetical protein
VIYIVPSRALINQVSEELRVDLNGVEIKTDYIENEEKPSDKIVYILTPERAIKIINENDITLNPAIIFIDEIQGVEDEQGRGNLFEHVFGELSRLFSYSKIITAGPNILNAGGLYRELFQKESIVSDTELSPVFQLRTIINIKEASINFTVFGNNSKTQTITKNIVHQKNLKKLYEGNRGDGLAVIINKIIANNKDSNIVYSSKSNWAETWAIKYADSIEQGEIQQEISDLIDYLKEDIHSKYILIDCLKKGVAFHHSKLPELVRKEIEVLFQRGRIKTLFCTSTLLEGVNMPANNLFILKPENNNLRLSNFEFGNLIGRAGRIKDSLYGTIYCITLDAEDWATLYYESTYSKEVVTSSTKGVNMLKTDDLDKSIFDVDEQRLKNLLINLRHRYMKGDQHLETFLKKKGLTDGIIAEVEEKLVLTLKDITIPYDIVKKNPTVDPLLQNELFQQIRKDGIKKWVININSRFSEGYSREVAETLDYEFNSFYWQFHSLTVRLSEIFRFRDELYFRDGLRISESSMCQNSVRWIEGRSMGEIISRRIHFLATYEKIPEDRRIDPNNVFAINKVIRDIININSKAITFSLLRYIKLLCYILETQLSEEEKYKYKYRYRYRYTLSLPTFLELGTKEPVIIRLITSGMPRSIALKIYDKFRLTHEHRVLKMDVIEWLKTLEKVEGLKAIYNKFLWRQKYLKVNNKSEYI